MNTNSNSSLFNNPMIDSALKGMTPEQLYRYKELGENMYNSVRFEDSELLTNLPPPIAESAAYVVEGLKSGLHPTDLDTNELAVMNTAYGKTWYEQFGFTEDDIPVVVEDEPDIKAGHFGIEIVEDPNIELSIDELNDKLKKLQSIIDNGKSESLV
jgi:hypothetical protein